jgi:broad specificity phosphatase PhoE
VPSIFLVRHAQASFGSDDYDVLSPVGHEQTQLLTAALARRQLNVTRVAGGTARRQLDTAAPCAAERGLEVEVDPRWNEYETEEVLEHHGEAAVSLTGTGTGGEGITSRQFQAVLDGALAAWVANGGETTAAQSWTAFFDSRTAVLAELASSLGSGETGLAFTSGGVIAAIGAHLLGGHADLFPALNRVLVNTGITKLAVGRAGVSLISFNEHAHLDDGGGKLLTYR